MVIVGWILNIFKCIGNAVEWGQVMMNIIIHLPLQFANAWMFDVKSAFVIAIVKMIILHWTRDTQHEKEINAKRKKWRSMIKNRLEVATLQFIVVQNATQIVSLELSALRSQLSADNNLKMEIQERKKPKKGDRIEITVRH